MKPVSSASSSCHEPAEESAAFGSRPVRWPVEGLDGKQLRPFLQDMKELADEAHDIRLQHVVRLSKDELRDAAGADGVMIQEIDPKNSHGLNRGFIGQERAEQRGDVPYAGSEVPQNVVEVVGVLVLATIADGKSLENNVCAGAAHPHIPRGPLPEQGYAGQGDTPSIEKREAKPRRNERGEVRFNAPERTALVALHRGRDQEVESDLLCPSDAPPLTRCVSLVVLRLARSRHAGGGR